MWLINKGGGTQARQESIRLEMASPPQFINELRCGEGIAAAFVERIPGVRLSTNKEATLKLLEPAHRECVECMGFSSEGLWRAEQVHGNRVCEVPHVGAKNRVLHACDGLITKQRGVLLGIYVADCAAVYLIDEEGAAIGLLHSGRKGTELGIVEKGIRMMGSKYGTQPDKLKLVISPCIRPPHYEVDFARAIHEQALQAGVLRENISDEGICTAENLKHYYSYRREKGCTGRMLALLGLRSSRGASW